MAHILRTKIVCTAAFLAISIASAASGADSLPRPDMERCAKTATQLAWAADGVSLDFSASSLSYVDQVFLRLRRMPMDDDQRDMLVGVFGCYVGEVMIRNLGGAWYFPSEEERNFVQERAVFKNGRLERVII